jgi:hypothetical protein
MERLRLADPALAGSPPGVTSCEHCRTVTWAGVPACSCEFGRLAISEESAFDLCYPANTFPRMASVANTLRNVVELDEITIS